MTHQTAIRFILRMGKVMMMVALLGQSALALASSSRPLPPSGIYAIAPVPGDPSPAPTVNLQPDSTIYNQLVYRQVNGLQGSADGLVGQNASPSGPGVLTDADGMSSGVTLFTTPTACLDFNDINKWNGHIWYAAYGNWGTFSVDDGGFYRPDHVTFDMERAIGPGDRAGSEFSFKIAGDRPYAAGLVSPIIQAEPGTVVSVRIKYLLFNQSGLRVGSQIVNDWVSLGIKADAHGEEAVYVNGYARGQWSELVNTVIAGESGQVLILLQAESPAALNSNVYFDDVEIAVGTSFLTACE